MRRRLDLRCRIRRTLDYALHDYTIKPIIEADGSLFQFKYAISDVNYERIFKRQNVDRRLWTTKSVLWLLVYIFEDKMISKFNYIPITGNAMVIQIMNLGQIK